MRVKITIELLEAGTRVRGVTSTVKDALLNEPHGGAGEGALPMTRAKWVGMVAEACMQTLEFDINELKE